MAANMKRVALVTGANQGIGYHIVDQLATRDPELTVLLGARDASKGADAVSRLGRSNVKSILVDIDSMSTIQHAAEQIKTEYGGLDILINNAGMAFKGDAFNEEVVKRTLQTNYYGTLDMVVTFLPLIRPNGKIINVSSRASVSALAKLAPPLREQFLDSNLSIDGLTRLMDAFRSAVADGSYKEKGYPETAYGMSKVGVSILTRIFARQMRDGITISSGCPGWCRTSMAGNAAPRSAEDGATTFSHMALLPSADFPNGQFWEDGKVSALTPSDRTHLTVGGAHGQDK